MADCPSLRVFRLSPADYLRATACPSRETSMRAVLTLRPYSLLTAGYLRRGRLNFTRCHLVYFWHALTPVQKIGFEGAYSRGCKCQVSGLLSVSFCHSGTGPCPTSLFLDLFPCHLPLWMTLAPPSSSWSLASSPCFLPAPCPLSPFLLASTCIQTYLPQPHPVTLVFLDWDL